MQDLELSGFIERKFQQSLPADIYIEGGGHAKHLNITGSAEGLLEVDSSHFGSFLISQLNFQINQNTLCAVQTQGSIMGLYFNLSGGCSNTDAGKEMTLSAGEQIIYYASDHQKRLRLLPENGVHQSLEINIPAEYYADLFSGYSGIQDEFIHQILNKANSFLPLASSPMTMPMKWIINTIKQSTRLGVMKRLFLEAKILELLMLQVEQAEATSPAHKNRVPNSAERDSLYEAKTILERSLNNPPTIRALARMVGMNEFNLKKGFKDTFHTTLYNYVNTLKMQQAKQILLEGNKSITEVSLLSGYKNPQHFTAAFKKFYGMLPSKLKE